MPKVKCSEAVKLRKYVKEFGEEIFSTDGTILFCKACEVKVAAIKRFNVQQHCATAKHKSCANRKSSELSRQALLFDTAKSSSTKLSDFSKDLCEMLVSTNIPLNKVNNEHFRKFLTKYTTQSIPDEATLRKSYLPSCYEDALRKIRISVGNNSIWVSIDETTDVCGRYVANVIVGTLLVDRPGDVNLLHSEVLDAANHSTIAILFDNAMKLLWDGEVKRERILLLLTDAAPYMVKAAKGLKVLYPKMVHLTCLAHGLHRVAEEIRQNFPDVDRLISNVKKIFVKAPLRVAKFKDHAPSLPLPPQPVLTRWGTWLNAVVYYCEHYEIVQEIVSAFDSSEASSIKIAQELFSNDLSGQLAYISSNYRDLPKTISRLETAGLELCESLGIVKDMVSKVEQARGTVSVAVKNKLSKVLSANEGYATMCRISAVLEGNGFSLGEDDPQLSSSEVTMFKYAPVTSCDVERSFSQYKKILSDLRRRFLFDSLRMHMVVMCNAGKNED